MARVYSVLLKNSLPKKPSLSRNGVTQPNSIVQFYYVVSVYAPSQWKFLDEGVPEPNNFRRVQA